MNYIRRKYFYWAASLLFILVIGVTIYFYLGGFQEIILGQSINNSYSISGKYVTGKRMHKEERALFEEVKNLIKEKKLNGDLCIVDYRYDTLEEGEIHRFIGVLLGDEITAIPSGYSVIELTSKVSYKAALTMHPLVMPNSEKVENALRSMANDYNDSLKSYSMEVFFPDNSVLVEMFAH